MSTSKKVIDENDEEQRLLIEFCVAKKKDFLVRFLREKELAYSGNKDELRSRLQEYLTEEKLTIRELVEFLNSVEGWGNQHIYLYQAVPGALAPWLNIKESRKILKENKVEELLNAPKPLVMPARAALGSIELTESHLKFIWIERKVWYQRLEDKDEYPTDDLILKAYRKNVERRLTSFEVNLIEGNAYLSIPNISKATVDKAALGPERKNKDHYEVLKKQFEEALDPFVKMHMFTRLRLGKAIVALEKSDEVKSREDSFETVKGGRIIFQSTDVESDTKTDKDMTSVKKNIPTQVKGVEGSYYWQPGHNNLKRQLFTKLSVHDGSVAFRVQCAEEEVRNVLSRIRKLCK